MIAVLLEDEEAEVRAVIGDYKSNKRNEKNKRKEINLIKNSHLVLNLFIINKIKTL
jgi:hypothetical protein